MISTTYDQRRQFEALAAKQLAAHQLTRLNRLLKSVLPQNRFYAGKLAHLSQGLGDPDGPLALWDLAGKILGQPVWQLSYSVPDANGIRASLIASGHSRSKLDGHLVLDLYRVFDSYCRGWSAAAALGVVPAADAPPAVIPMPPRHLRIVPEAGRADARPASEPLHDRRVA